MRPKWEGYSGRVLLPDPIPSSLVEEARKAGLLPNRKESRTLSTRSVHEVGAEGDEAAGDHDPGESA